MLIAAAVNIRGCEGIYGGRQECCRPLYKPVQGGTAMIEVTRLNDTKLTINADLIERVEELPDTVITMTTGYKVIVKESRQEVRDLVILYKREILNREL